MPFSALRLPAVTHRIAVLVLATGAALGAPAFADEAIYQSSNGTAYVWDPATQTYVERPAVVYDRVYSAPPVTYVVPAQSVTYENPIIVTAPSRAEEDSLINGEVADRLADDPSLRGHIETQTFRNTVTLGGRVTTPGMVDRAERDAKSVEGVRDVENRLRPSVGEH
jgi:hypothetical protein